MSKAARAPTMIERVADAIGACATEFTDARLALEAVGGNPERFIQLRLARAAIEAMRELPDETLTYVIFPWRAGNTDEFNALLRKTVQEYHSRAIDATLQEKQT